MVINRFGFDAISLEGNGGNVVEGNFIGTDPTGTLARPNGSGGIRVFSSGNRIGGLTAAARNVISGNHGHRYRDPELDRDRQRGAGQLHRPQCGGHGGAAERVEASAASRSSTAPAATPSAGRWRVPGTSSPATPATRSACTARPPTTTSSRATSSAPTRPARSESPTVGIGVDVVSAQRTIVGGPGLARNVISGNGTGIQIRTSASGTKVQNNYIGLNAAGTAAIFNGLGISINSNAGVEHDRRHRTRRGQRHLRQQRHRHQRADRVERHHHPGEPDRPRRGRHRRSREHGRRHQPEWRVAAPRSAAPRPARGT